VRHDRAAQVGFEATDQQKHAVIKTVFDPLVMAVHELAGFAFVV